MQNNKNTEGKWYLLDDMVCLTASLECDTEVFLQLHVKVSQNWNRWLL